MFFLGSPYFRMDWKVNGGHYHEITACATSCTQLVEQSMDNSRQLQKLAFRTEPVLIKAEIKSKSKITVRGLYDD